LRTTVNIGAIGTGMRATVVGEGTTADGAAAGARGQPR
jgi:hypothetical protein